MEKNCTDGHPCWLRYETRQWANAMGAAVDVWKATGDGDYLTIAKEIFQNALLNLERNVDNQRKGYINNESRAHMFYQVLIIKSAIHLYHACDIDGDQNLALQVKAWLIRHAEMMRDDVYINWQNGPANTPVVGGTYGIDEQEGKYFSYGVMNSHWVAGEPWPRDIPGYYYVDPSYSGNYADLFAFVYEATHDAAWLALARAVYKDAWTYGTSAGDWVEISDTLNFTFSGVPANPVSGWLKNAKQLTKPMYYLKVEEAVGNGSRGM